MKDQNHDLFPRMQCIEALLDYQDIDLASSYSQKRSSFANSKPSKPVPKPAVCHSKLMVLHIRSPRKLQHLS